MSRIGGRASLNFWLNSPVKPSGPGLLFVGRFLITVSISVLVLGLLRFSISFFDFCACDGSVKIFYFFLLFLQFWKVILF